MTDGLTPDEEDSVLAAEYALGLLTQAEADAFEQRLAVDPGFRAQYARWTTHFTALMENVAPVAPPARVLTAIKAQLWPTPERSLWSRIGILPALAGAALAAVVVLGLLNLDRFTAGPVVPEYTAAIAAEDQSLIVMASFDVETGALLLERTTGAVAADRSQELWLIVPDAAAPISLGLLSEEDVTTIVPPEDLAGVIAGATLAISDEPPGGSPTGAPTTVLAVGAVRDA